MQKKIFQPIALSFALLLACVSSVSAQILSSNRWLFVVDTSLAMERRSEATLQAVQNLLLSGMSGQLRHGDTIGLWTFNDDLYTGRYPLRVWQPEYREPLTLATVEFLKQQRFEKIARFDVVIPSINELVTDSDILTVILITDGVEEIHGTPFDAVINAAFKQDYRHQRNAREPFVIALRASGGKLVDYTMTFAPWLAKFPPLPPEPPQPVVVKAEPVPEPKPKAVVSSLILSGKKPEATNTVEIATAPVEQPTLMITNPEPVVTNIPPPAIPVETTNVESTSLVTETPAPLPEKLMTHFEPEMPTVPEVPVVQILPPPAEMKPPVVQVVEPAVTETKAIEPEPLPAPSVQPLTERKTTVETTVVEENVPATSMTTTQIPAVVAPGNPAPLQPALVTPPQADSGNQPRLLIGLGLLIAAMGIGIFWLRRSRPAPHGSLITHSLDKDKK